MHFGPYKICVLSHFSHVIGQPDLNQQIDIANNIDIFFSYKILNKY